MDENNTKSGTLKVVFLVVSLVVSIILGIIAMFDTQLTAWHYGVAFYVCVMGFFVIGYLVFSDEAFNRKPIASNVKIPTKAIAVSVDKSAKPVAIKTTPKVGLVKAKEFEKKRSKRKGSRK